MASKKPMLTFDSAPRKTHAPDVAETAPRSGLLNEMSKEQTMGERVVLVRREMLVSCKYNQNVYDVTGLRALAADIARRGIQQPLIVRQRSDGKFTITAGHRRKAANDIAVDELGYKEGEYVPVIIRASVKDDISEREALVLDNLQRDKTDYNRMMEIVELKECALARRERGEDIPNLREYILERLDVSNSEIQRFDKIHTSLSNELQQKFRDGCFSTNVAYSIATSAADGLQAYIIEHWDWSLGEDSDKPHILTYPDMEKLMLAYAKEQENPKETKEPGKAKSTVSFSSIDEGLSTIDSTFSQLSARIRGISSLNKAETNKIIKRAEKVFSEIATLQGLLDEMEEKKSKKVK